MAGSSVPDAGSSEVVIYIDGYLNEPLLLTRDKSENVHCLSNVCTHRGNLLVHEPCQGATQIRCGYHSRRFDLAGRTLSIDAPASAREAAVAAIAAAGFRPEVLSAEGVARAATAPPEV